MVRKDFGFYLFMNIVDLKWSNFVERKSDFVLTEISRLRELIYMKFKPKYLRIDNSGENLKLKNYLINNIGFHSIRNINI